MTQQPVGLSAEVPASPTDPVEPRQDERGAWFEHEVVALLPDLLGTALRLAKNRADAEDLVADSISTAWSRLPALRDATSFRSWIFRIMSNRFVSDCRARATRGMVALDDDDGDVEDFSLFARLHQPILLWWSNPEQDFLDRLLREDLEHAVDALPECFRIVVVLVDLQSFSYQEAADTLEIPIGTVRSRLARGRALLQKSLWLHAQDAGVRPMKDSGPDHTAQGE